MGSGTTNTYEILCGCGRSWSGGRLSRPQNVPCPNCGERFLVLPEASPLPDSFTKHTARRQRIKRLSQPKWRWPFSVGETLLLLLGIALVIAGYVWKLNHPVEN